MNPRPATGLRRAARGGRLPRLGVVPPGSGMNIPTPHSGSSTSTSNATYTASTPSSASPTSSPDAARFCDELLLGRIELAGSDERHVLGGHGLGVDRHAQRHPPLLPLGDDSGVLRSPCASNQTTASRPSRWRAPITAPTCTRRRPPARGGALRQRAGDRRRLLGGAFPVDDAGFRIEAAEKGRLDHRLPRLHPRRGHAHEPGAVGASTGVAFVLPAFEGHRGQRAAVGAPPGGSTRLKGSWDQLVQHIGEPGKVFTPPPSAGRWSRRGG